MIVRGTLVCLFTLFLAAPVFAQEIEVLELESVGIPSPADRKEARRLSELFLFDGRLYLGTGDGVVNTGPAPVLSFDLEQLTTEVEFTVDDEAVYRYRLLDGKLAIPGPDATESWDFGNVYVREADGWVKHRTLPRAVHVNDLLSVGGVWLATTGTSFEFPEGNQIAAGSILMSRDKGQTWAVDYLTAVSGVGVHRVDRIVRLGNFILAFPYAYAGFPVEQIPPEVQKYAGTAERHGGRTYQTLYYPDHMGAAETLQRTATGWRPLDLVPVRDVCRVHPIVFGKRFLLSVTAGKQVAPLSGYTIDDPIPVPGADLTLWVFDGEKTLQVPFECDGILDSVVRDERLSLLVVKDGHYWIAETEDLETWRWLALPLDRDRPLCLERVGETYWLGTKDGNLFRTTGEVSRATEPEVIGHLPVQSFDLRGTMIREAHGYWGAVTRIEKPGLPVRARFEFESKTKIVVATSNVTTFQFEALVPLKPASETDFTLIIDGQELVDAAGLFRVFECTRGPDGKWTLELIEDAPKVYEPKPQVIGESEDDFAVADPALAQWAAEALAAKTGADLTLVPIGNFRRGLSKGPVTIQDLHDAPYRNRIAVFEIKGTELTELVLHNASGPEDRRCIMVGDVVVPGTGYQFAAEKTYRVALPDYPARKGERYFGRDLGEFEIEGELVTALIEHLLRNGKITRNPASTTEDDRNDK